MGLSGPRNRRKLDYDPNNTKWTRDETTFGQKILRAQGWEPGKYLGSQDADRAQLHSAASLAPIKVSMKDDTLGLGAKIRQKQSDECTGLDVFKDLLGRLNGKSEETLQKERKVRSEIKTNLYVERKFGPMRFVSGGFLVGDQIKMKELIDSQPATTSDKEESESESEKEVKSSRKEKKDKKEKKEKKSKKRKASESEDAEASDDKPDKKRKKRSKTEAESDNEDSEAEKSTKKKDKKEKKEKKEKKDKKEKKEKKENRAKRSERTSDDEEDADSAGAEKKRKKSKKSKDQESGSDGSTETSEDAAAQEKSRKEKKKDKKRKRSADADASGDATASTTTSAATPQESGSSTPLSTNASIRTTALSARHLARSRNIASKRLAFGDMQALNQIFMVKPV